MSSFTIRNAREGDANRCHEIETAAYEGDEAATLEKIAFRAATYPEGFLVLEDAGELVGFINSGCAHVVDLANEALKDLSGHDPDAAHVVILSVVVDPEHQGLGLSQKLMTEFVTRMRRENKASIQLICKERHVGLYERFGYRYLRPSASEHGGMQWHEMSMEL